MPTLFLGKKEVSGLLNMPAIIEAVEQAFRDWALGRAKMPAKAYIVLDRGDFRAMPAAIPGAVGIKWVNVHEQNPSQGLPTVMAILVYSDPLTGYPLAVMDATEITAYRTGAAGAIASKYLARKNARTLGLIGAGKQAHTQLQAHVGLFHFDHIRVFDLFDAPVQRLIEAFPQYPVKRCSMEEAAASDIVCTVTPAHEPFLRAEWILPGTHINAIGADAEGKEELYPEVLQKARIIVDDLRQASSSGEINVPLRKGLISGNDIYANLSEIVIGKKQGRVDDDEVTVFDSTGLAIEDIATAKLVYEKAKQTGGYQSLKLVD